MRRTVISVLAALGTVAGAATAMAEPETKDLKISFGIDLPFAPHVIALEKGWFEEAGFDSVEPKTFTAGALAGEALLAGEIHIWQPSNIPPTSMAHNAIPVVLIGNGSTLTGLEKLVVRNDANVNKPEDLYNIKIGLLIGSSSGMMLDNIIKAYDLDRDRIQAVNLAPPEALASMAANEIQGLLIWEPWPYRALQEIDSKVVHTGLKSFFDDNKDETVQVANLRSVFVAAQDFARDNPETIKAYLDVMARAHAYAADPANKDEVVAAFAAFQDQPAKMSDDLYENYVYDLTIDDAFLADVNAVVDYLVSVGRIDSGMDATEFVYTDALKAVDPDLVKAEGAWKP
ncbi:MAG: ABC transporter substrate-binding protein [Hyphomicrobiales bacterium]|nr:ABC transporter substrate-binding protein [Hyphomicrobiales bacterium]